MKRCKNPHCQQQNPQSPDEFNRKRGTADGLQYWCKSCQHASNRLHREDTIKRNRERRVSQRDLYLRYSRIYADIRRGVLSKEPCNDCRAPQTTPYVSSPDDEIKWYCTMCRPSRSGGKAPRNFRRIIVDFSEEGR